MDHIGLCRSIRVNTHDPQHGAGVRRRRPPNAGLSALPNWESPISLLAALLPQVLLKLTIALEHRVGAYFNAKSGGFARFMRYLTAWPILFGSKFVILETLVFAFGDAVDFGGPLHGLVILIAVVVTMLVAEEAILRFYRRLA